MGSSFELFDMKMSRFLLTFLFCISSLYSCEGITCKAGWSQLSTKGYSYKYYKWPAGSSTLIVDVKGDRDANIMFSPCDGCGGYRILLGGWDNYKSFISEEGGDQSNDQYVVTPGILSTEEFRRFYISVGRYTGFFKIQVLNANEEIVMERTWESLTIPWSWPVPFVAFSGYTQNPMVFKFKSSTNTTTPDTTVPTTPPTTVPTTPPTTPDTTIPTTPDSTNTTTPTKPPLVDSTCPAGWSESGGNCYKYFDNSVKWDDARKRCLSEEADLASIHSEEENDFLREITGNTHAWVGGRRSCPSCNDFNWSDGTPMDFTAWHPLQPDNKRGAEECMVINWQWNGSSGWNDAPCDRNITIGRFVCKKSERDRRRRGPDRRRTKGTTRRTGRKR